MGFFPSCSVCGKYSPFLIDEKVLRNENARRAIKTCIERSQFVLCPICLPNPQTSLTPDCLLTDDDFHQLVLGFEVSDLGDFQSLGIAQVVIISKETKINPRFKELARKPLPKTVKLRKLLKAFPDVHRMRFRDYGYEKSWLRELQQRCTAISSFYLDGNTLHLHDNFDLMVERTPLHERTSNRSRGRSFIDDSLRMRFPTSGQGTRNISMNSLRSVATSRNDSASDLDDDAISSQSVEESRRTATLSQSISEPRRMETESESFNISSQSRNQSNTSVTSSLESSSDNTVIGMNPTPARNVGVTIEHSPQPGPSGLQQSTFPMPARRRSPQAINPRPENFREVRVAGARLPRVPGG
ncbi:uncharacterized protein LOC126575257 [Anopheles aquasalis]|uniref:uncharacterized protein LOC126575257 n=1 Tax=Anopheles aquasalis TaxID=42839 RepID=UPI00215AE5C6|nr:uncharacterized protein LOC126575257 [Anopheles aquasalis]